MSYKSQKVTKIKSKAIAETFVCEKLWTKGEYVLQLVSIWNKKIQMPIEGVKIKKINKNIAYLNVYTIVPLYIRPSKTEFKFFKQYLGFALCS